MLGLLAAVCLCVCVCADELSLSHTSLLTRHCPFTPCFPSNAQTPKRKPRLHTRLHKPAWQEQKRGEFEEMMREREMDRRLNPRTQEDFDMLYASLQKWHGEQLDAVRMLPESEQHRARMQLLREETKYLNFIEQLKQIASTDNKDARVQKFLDATCSGRSWVNKEYGKKVVVETPESKIAKELRDVYNLIRIPDLDVDERLDALLQLKTVVEKHDSRLTREILELIQREADLLGRRTRLRNLEGGHRDKEYCVCLCVV